MFGLGYAALPYLTGWANFYVIVGSAAGALTGLQFVVMALVSQYRTEAGMAEIRAFGTPTIVHFCAVLLVSALMSAPWAVYSSVAIVLYVFGSSGVVYTVIILRRAGRQPRYQPVMEDWLWHCVFPLLSYISFVLAAKLLITIPELALFILADAELFLLFIGIHNAWDTVTYVVIEKSSTGANRQV